MAKKKPLPKDVAVPKASFFDDLSPQAKQAIAAVVMAIIGVFFLASLFEVGGPVGHYTYLALSAMFGTGAYLSPLICGFYVYALLNPKDDNHVSGSKVIGIAVFFLAVLGTPRTYERRTRRVDGTRAPMAT
jgi:amino acid transporter